MFGSIVMSGGDWMQYLKIVVGIADRPEKRLDGPGVSSARSTAGRWCWC